MQVDIPNQLQHASLCNHQTMMIFALSCILFHIGYVELANKRSQCMYCGSSSYTGFFQSVYLRSRFTSLSTSASNYSEMDSHSPNVYKTASKAHCVSVDDPNLLLDLSRLIILLLPPALSAGAVEYADCTSAEK